MLVVGDEHITSDEDGNSYDTFISCDRKYMFDMYGLEDGVIKYLRVMSNDIGNRDWYDLTKFKNCDNRWVRDVKLRSILSEN